MNHTLDEHTLQEMKKIMHDTGGEVSGEIGKVIRNASGEISDAMNNSVLNTSNANATIRTLAFSIAGALMAGYGIKICHEAFKQISAKLYSEENKKLSWRAILTRGDYLYLLVGLGALGCGFGLIANGNRL